MRRPPLKASVAKATMNAGNSINKRNVAQAVALGSLLVAFATVPAQDKPTPAVLRRTPGSVGVTAKPNRPVRIADTQTAPDAPAEVADENVVPASDTTGVNRVRIRAVEPPADYVPAVTRRTTPAPSSSRTNSTSKQADNTASTEELPPPPAQTTPQVANRLPPLGRTIGTPAASAPLRASAGTTAATAPSRTTTTAPLARNTASTSVQTTQPNIASAQTAATSSGLAANATTSTPGRKPASRASTTKAPPPKENSGLMSYFDPTRIMPWMRQDSPEKAAAARTAEAESVVIDQGSASTPPRSTGVSQASPKPKVAQKAKKKPTKTAQPAEVAATEDGNTSSSFLNPLKSVRQIWSGTEPSKPKPHLSAKAQEAIAEYPGDVRPAETPEQATPQQKPSMLAQLFGRGRAPDKVVTKATKGTAPPVEDSEVEISSSEPTGEVAIEHKPTNKSFGLSDGDATQVPEAFRAPAPAARQTASVPVAKPPVDSRAANAKLGAPIIELADEEIAGVESDRVIR